MDNYPDSLLVKECNKATCNWYQHPQNNCPDNPAQDSALAQACDTVEACTKTWGCENYNCNCNEWFNKVLRICHNQFNLQFIPFLTF